MQRYSSSNRGGGFSNNAVGGTTSVRDRLDSSLSSNLSMNSRKLSQLSAYKLKCEKESLSFRLGPPDFYPQAPNCPEETLTREYLLSGYKETVEGIEESREITLTHIGLHPKSTILKCKEAIKKCLRAINESRAQKRKAGQVYRVPLSGKLLSKPGVFPELKQLGEDARKKWIEGLSQRHKHLRLLADHVPHGYRKKGLFEVIIRHNVPILRATWFIKVTYLNQIRPTTGGISSGTPDKSQFARTELWTKDLIEYMQHLLDGFLAKDGIAPRGGSRDQTSQTLVSYSSHRSNDLLPAVPNVGDPSLQFKWDYVLRLLIWNCSEGILFPSLILEWVLSQLQEKDSVDVLEFLLPIIVDLAECVSLSQIYVRVFVDIAIRFLQILCQGGMDTMVNAKRPHLASPLVELLRYLLLSAPDAFVCLDCFPLPISVAPDFICGKSAIPMIPGLADNFKHESQDSLRSYLSFGHIASSLRRRASNLAKIANVNLQGHGMAKIINVLDKALIHGDTREAYTCLFDKLSDAAVDESWIAEVSPCLRSSLKWIGTVNFSVVYAVFSLCEWATCDFRDIRNFMPQNVKLTGRKDFCQVYIAVLILKYWMEDTHNSFSFKKNSSSGPAHIAKTQPIDNDVSDEANIENIYGSRIFSNNFDKRSSSSIFESPGPLHDIIVCWLDHHEFGKGESFRRLQVLIVELIRHGIFYPQAYVRQLIVSGIMDKTGTSPEFDTQRRHSQILKQLPGAYIFDTLEESKTIDAELLPEVVNIYSNERNLALHGLCNLRSVHIYTGQHDPLNVFPENHRKIAVPRDHSTSSMVENREHFSADFSDIASKRVKSRLQVNYLKGAICSLLHLPYSCCTFIEKASADTKERLKISSASSDSKLDSAEGRFDTEECKRTKKQKTINERFSHIQGSSNQSDDENTWWVKKETKSLVSFKPEQLHKSVKPTSRKSKSIRKTQSLAQLQALRIESSQSASTSHACDNKSNCSHHKSAVDSEVPNLVGVAKTIDINDIGKSFRKLRCLQKRSVVIWLLKCVRSLIEGNAHITKKLTDHSVSFSPLMEEKGLPWKFGEDEFSSIVYLLDISSDLYSLVKFLLWLFPMAVKGTSDVTLGRNSIELPRNKENNICNIEESVILSALQRYENVIVATDLIPELLNAAMHQAVSSAASTGRVSNKLTFVYAQNLLKKYGTVISVAKWAKCFQATSDKRLIAEFESGRSLDADMRYTFGIPAGVEDIDDFFRHKISGRTSRAGQIMKDMFSRKFEEQFYGKVNKFFSSTTDIKWEDGYQIAQKIVSMLLECIRQNGSTSHEVDPSLVAAAVSAIVCNIGLSVGKLPDFTSASNHQSYSSVANSFSWIRSIVNVHIACLSLLKEALGEHFSRVLEIALAVEASSVIFPSFARGKVPRGQFHLSSEVNDISSNISNDISNDSSRLYSGRASKVAASVSALIVGAIIHGVSSLERMITVLRLNKGLDILQFVSSLKSNSNGISHSAVNFKSSNSIDINIHWFQLLVGNCRPLFDGLIVDILGEPHILALSRMQRMLPLQLAFPPVYSIFTMVIWRPYILNHSDESYEDIQLYKCLSIAIEDAIKHHPFRDLCLRDTHVLYELLSSDSSDCDFGIMLEQQSQLSPEKKSKAMSFVPLRARLFLNAILDLSMPSFSEMKDNGSLVSEHGESVNGENNQLVHILDTLQPAKFHWQWLELRLLLNEQAVMAMESNGLSVVDALRSLSTPSENDALSENENAFTDIVLTRLLVRPDAASLYSEVFHLLGRSLEEKLLLHAKWLLAGNDVLLGRKSIRQRLVNLAQSKGLSTKSQFWKPWGWARSNSEIQGIKAKKRKLEASSLEEGEFVDEGMDALKMGKSTMQTFGVVGINSRQLYKTDKALANLVLPSIDRSSNKTRTLFAIDLIKQMNTIYRHICTFTHGSHKHSTGILSSSGDGSGSKGNSRKGISGGSPGMLRRPSETKDSTPPPAAALKASIWLRLQFLLRLLPTICPEREVSNRSLRNSLASPLLHLLGTQLVYDDVDVLFMPVQGTSPRKEMELLVGSSIGNTLDISGESLFDMILSVLYGLLSGCKPSWLKSRSTSKLNMKSSRDFTVNNHEFIEDLQAHLDCMRLPTSIKRRLQCALPMLPRCRCSVLSCRPPVVSSESCFSLQPAMLTPGFSQSNPKSPQIPVSNTRTATNTSGRNKPLPPPDNNEMEIDPWLLLEDGVVSGSSSSSNNFGGSIGNDQSNLKASFWLKGAVRVRRTDLTYIGPMDDGS